MFPFLRYSSFSHIVRVVVLRYSIFFIYYFFYTFSTIPNQWKYFLCKLHLFSHVTFVLFFTRCFCLERKCYKKFFSWYAQKVPGYSSRMAVYRNKNDKITFIYEIYNLIASTFFYYYIFIITIFVFFVNIFFSLNVCISVKYNRRENKTIATRVQG